MAALSKKLRSLQGGRVMFRCPGCGGPHQIPVEKGLDQQGPVWGYNGNPDAPTFTPSILITWNEPSDIDEEFDDPKKDRKMVCHSFVTDGWIRFLHDCTHALAGNVVEIPDWEDA